MCKLHIFWIIAYVNKYVHITHMIKMLDALFASTARILVAQGVAFPEFVERMKAHYIAAAQEIAAKESTKITDSRLSVMTGLQRRDIARLRDFNPKEGRTHNLSRLVALWQTETEYSKEGRARALPRTGAAPSFEALAKLVNRDVHSRTMLDALSAAGTVKVAKDGTVKLLQSSFQPLAGSEDQIRYLASNVGDHVAAATENVLGLDPPHFERAVHYTRLTKDQIAQLEQEFAQSAMEIFERVSQNAADMKRNSAGAHRFRAGSYFYTTEESDI